MHRVSKGQSVSFICSSFLEDGTSLDDDSSLAPIVMRAGERGSNQISTAVANSLIGMKSNETKQVTLAARQAFGEVDPNLFYRLPMQQGKQYHVGDDMQITITDRSGDKTLDGVIARIEDGHALVDTNHPFAGKKLLIKIKVQSIK